MNARALIECLDIGLVRGGRCVLDVDRFAVVPGEVVLLTGDNGSGKTTLLKILAGLLTAERGHFRCLGTGMSPAAAARFCRGRHVYLHQTPYLFDASVASNIAYGLELRGEPPSVRDVAVHDALAWAGLSDLAARPAALLSTGEKQRVALLRAHVLRPPLLLLDEITANQDRASRQRTYRLIEELSRTGTGIVFATHDTEPCTHLRARSCTLAHGRLVTADTGGDRATVVPLARPAERRDER